MGVLIGQPIKDQLDVVVNSTFGSTQIQNSLENLFAAAVGGTLFGGSLVGMQSYIDQRRIDDQVNTQLGAMGIF